MSVTPVLLAIENPYANLSGTTWLILLLVSVALSALMFWKVFEKAGQPGWASLVPIYNMVVLAKVAGKAWWWGLLSCLPYVGIVFFIFVCIGVAEHFGKSGGFVVGLVLLAVVFYPILGFGSAQYRPSGDSFERS